MAAYLHDNVLDNGLQELTDDANALHICSQLPATYAEASSTYTLGNKAPPTVSVPGDRAPSGRKVTISAITDGSVTGTGQATHWALVDTVGTRLMAAQTLSGGGQAVTSGNTFTLTAFDIGIPDPA